MARFSPKPSMLGALMWVFKERMCYTIFFFCITSKQDFYLCQAGGCRWWLMVRFYYLHCLIFIFMVKHDAEISGLFSSWYGASVPRPSLLCVDKKTTSSKGFWGRRSSLFTILWHFIDRTTNRSIEKIINRLFDDENGRFFADHLLWSD